MIPKEIARALGIPTEDERDQVVVGKLTEDEKACHLKSVELGDKMLRMVEQLEIMKREAEAIDGRMWHKIEDRLKVSGRIQLSLNSRTEEIRMAREDADYLKIPYVEKEVHPEYKEAQEQSFASQLHRR